MELMLQPIRKYAEFSGRARRAEYWMFVLFYCLVVIALMIVSAVFGAVLGSAGRGLAVAVLGLFGLAMIVPSLAVSFRRLHDINKSAWWILISLVPFVGGLVLLVFHILPGTVGPNQYGPDPKALPGGEAAVFS